MANNNSLFTFESFNQERLFEVDATDFVTHERKNLRGKIVESAYWKTREMFEMNGPDKVYTIQGIYINDLSGNRDALTDESAAIAVDDRYITVPTFQIKEIQAMLDSQEAIKCIRAGHAGCTIEEYTNKFGTNYKLVWQTI